eukprot:TRINITY_DN3817_c0_g2_i4.p1 TRINITY_DN3817_c0_g2~~TRINITY_DN3817_c0_g2_i4.p1  ORF type:complete len:678 (+),score=114.81 TRINITY_DN3817_c0_g2_i4:67-2100(+)
MSQNSKQQGGGRKRSAVQAFPVQSLSHHAAPHPNDRFDDVVSETQADQGTPFEMEDMSGDEIPAAIAFDEHQSIPELHHRLHTAQDQQDTLSSPLAGEVSHGIDSDGVVAADVHDEYHEIQNDQNEDDEGHEPEEVQHPHQSQPETPDGAMDEFADESISPNIVLANTTADSLDSFASRGSLMRQMLGSRPEDKHSGTHPLESAQNLEEESPRRTKVGEWRDHSLLSRAYHASCSDGTRIFLFGGLLVQGLLLDDEMPIMPPSNMHPSLQHMYIYTPADRKGESSWKEISCMTSTRPGFRSLHQMTTDGERVYVFGGINQEGRISSKVYVYDIIASTWSISAVAKGVAPRCLFHCMAICNMKLYIFGGARTSEIRISSSIPLHETNQLDVYDIPTRTWTTVTPTGPAPPPCFFSTMVAIKSKLYVYGGRPSFSSNHTLSGAIYCYDTDAQTWSVIENQGPSPGFRYGHCCATDGHSGLWVLGGTRASFNADDLNYVYYFNISKGYWEIVYNNKDKSCPTPLKYATVEWVSGTLHVIGGHRDPLSPNFHLREPHVMSSLVLCIPDDTYDTNPLARDLMRLVNKKDGSDVSIEVKGKEIYCHRAIISVRSPQLAALIVQDLTKPESAQMRICLDEYDHETVYNFVCYLYTGMMPKSLSLVSLTDLITVAKRHVLFDLWH